MGGGEGAKRAILIIRNISILIIIIIIIEGYIDNQEYISKFLWDIRIIRVNSGSEC